MAHYLVTGGAGFIGSHLCEELIVAATRVRVVDSLITGKRAISRTCRAWSSSRAISPIAASRAARCRHRLRAASGGDPVGAALGQGSDCVQSRQHRRVVERARRGARRRRQRVVYAGSSSAYGNADAAEGGDDADGAAVAVCAAEAGRRAVLPDVHAALRARDGDHPLLQRLRTPAGSVLAVLGRDLALHRALCEDRRRRSTATASRRATSPTSPTSWTACCGRARRRGRAGK